MTESTHCEKTYTATVGEADVMLWCRYPQGHDGDCKPVEDFRG